MVGTVRLGAESSRKDPNLHSVLLLRAGFTAGRLCIVSTPCAASSWLAQRALAQDVFSCTPSSAQAASMLLLGLFSPGVGQSPSFRQVICWCVVVAVGLIDGARAGLVTGRLGYGWRGWTQGGRFYVGFFIYATGSRLAQTSRKGPCLQVPNPFA